MIVPWNLVVDDLSPQVGVLDHPVLHLLSVPVLHHFRRLAPLGGPDVGRLLNAPERNIRIIAGSVVRNDPVLCSVEGDVLGSLGGCATPVSTRLLPGPPGVPQRIASAALWIIAVATENKMRIESPLCNGRTPR